MKSLRAEAKALIREDRNNVCSRSCWNCNSGHEYLKEAEYVINCPWCNHWYYKGKDVTEPDENT